MSRSLFSAESAAVKAEVEMTKEGIWDTGALFAAVPKVFPAADFVSPHKNVKAIFYEGLPFKGKQTRVFAWYGIPEAEKGEKVPAIVLVHGGGGTAFDAWVDLWVSRGYATIAMDLCGCVPSGTYGNWTRHENAGPAGWDASFAQINWKTEDQWVFHAIAGIVLADSLLRSFPGVDAERVGITGISWGGYLTCIAAGVDSRFKFAVPVYGCGFLHEDSVWTGAFKNMGKKNAGKWVKMWDPSNYLGNAAMPMLWVAGTNDLAYPLSSLQKSYRLPKSRRTLCIRVRMPHGHGGAGENPEEIRAFADSILKEGEPLAGITEQGMDKDKAWVKFSAEVPVEKAEFNYTKDKGAWMQRAWEIIPAELDESKNMVSALLPEGVTAWYFNIIDRSGLIVSSEYEEIH
ncbi:dipeptidyl aminopeptidase [Candidatus Desantisbacteria bacterium CG_4_10_14_0_8_um_filter_48_22]|uniref:Dipeptidyl aminopeptidase n=1 Tax=Candidatus Desantisbacteria bacterium CG_4_10_14_0_8_um_filter_48_22 TaxID=1974543 RepID=A0A2M7SE87_9BACT|nr:MAG: dipeptidyl aminopeptidase [Candidatus Desantisbacteria bacterium CG02_land_8_20_14_3_00_49_13]PIZ17828.1 MAG: dipeptidyl aminopeptidase [Candidatus Desantisbacteria bacterium CG_4_10_14_0_8_um_filter_48_22]